MNTFCAGFRYLLLLVAMLAVTRVLASDGVAIVNATIYLSPESTPIENGVLLVSDNRIVAVGPRETQIPAGYEVLDRGGKHIVAGFWNSHVHLVTPELLSEVLAPGTLSDAALEANLVRMFTSKGFTTVFDLASSTKGAHALATRTANGPVRGPRILSVGDPLYPKDGTPVYVIDLYRAHALALPEIESAKHALTRVREQAEHGVRGIKLFTGAIVGGEVGVLPMQLEHARAAVDEAREQGLPVFAHPTNLAGLTVAIDSGVDVLTHAAPLTGPWTPAFAQRLRDEDIAMIPTLALFTIHPDASTPVTTALQQVEALVNAGGDILFGTDSGFIDADEVSRELRLMAEVLDWREILATLTTTPARRFGEGHKRGKLLNGYAADFVILDNDPSKSAHAFTQIHETWRDGQPVFRALVAETMRSTQTSP